VTTTGTIKTVCNSTGFQFEHKYLEQLIQVHSATMKVSPEPLTNNTVCESFRSSSNLRKHSIMQDFKDPKQRRTLKITGYPSHWKEKEVLNIVNRYGDIQEIHEDVSLKSFIVVYNEVSSAFSAMVTLSGIRTGNGKFLELSFCGSWLLENSKLEIVLMDLLNARGLIYYCSI